MIFLSCLSFVLFNFNIRFTNFKFSNKYLFCSTDFFSIIYLNVLLFSFSFKIFFSNDKGVFFISYFFSFFIKLGILNSCFFSSLFVLTKNYFFVNDEFFIFLIFVNKLSKDFNPKFFSSFKSASFDNKLLII